MRQTLFILFSLFAVFYIFFIDTVATSWHMVFKLIPMLLLLVLAFTTPIEQVKRYKLIVCIGLLFCAIGDYTLQWFLIGLTSFLIGHLFYIAAFRSTNTTNTPLVVKILLCLYGLIMVIWIAGSIIQENDFVLAGAVVLYISVILMMGWTSFRVGTIWAVTGALLFIASDSVLAINRFIIDVAFSHEIIMLTYYGAQLCFVVSIAKYDEVQAKMVQ